MSAPITQTVTAVSLSPAHTFSKHPQPAIRLLAGLGVEGDAHMGATVRHRYLVRKDPTQPNLCQVHLLQAELFDELSAAGFDLQPGQIGENITTQGIDLLALPTGTLLALGAEAVVELTGLRTPCSQMNTLRPGLMKAVTGRDPRGNIVRKAGVMSIVLSSGEVRPGNAIHITLPPAPHLPLSPV
jgi:MOSC domain-containing protein YiiM